MTVGSKSTPQRAAVLSVASNSTLILVKLVLGLATQSVSVISEALHSFVDLVAALIAFYAVRKSAEPADESHLFGHGKFESISGVVEGLLIFLAAGAILYQAGHALQDRDYLSTPVGGIIAMAVSMVVNIVVSTILYRVARANDSIALEADALHLRTDVYSCAGVFLGLVVIQITHHKWLDPLLGIMVAGVVIRSAYSLTRRSLGDLVDVSLPEDERENLTRILEEHTEMGLKFHQVRSRRSGPWRHIDLHVEMPADLTVQKAHEICDHLERDILAALPRARVLIHAEPIGSDSG
jgi:cation diffusion facilitator family transporter